MCILEIKLHLTYIQAAQRASIWNLQIFDWRVLEVRNTMTPVRSVEIPFARFVILVASHEAAI